tara:strand:- start:632 stop:1492 length:861 start_codon:yes stop_codon:yes gene_type:complete
MIKGKREIIKKKYNKLKVKYDKNKDGLISLDEYLDKELSLGPKAEPTVINYGYQNWENIYNYFMIEFLYNKKFKILCIPNFVVEFEKSDFQIRGGIVYSIDNDFFYYNNSIKKSINDCKNNSKFRFIFFIFATIEPGSKSFAHANIVVIDLIKKTYERFEPYGYNNLRFENKIDKKFKNEIKFITGLHDFKYISPIDISPKLGIQSKADSYCGMCITISMMYLQLRILNPDLSQKKIVKFLLKKDKKDLKNMILKYARHVEKTLKKNKNIVFKLRKDFNEKIKELS